VARLAEAKARRAARVIGPSGDGAIVLGADTEVVLEGSVLGKPRDAEDARAMLERLRGREHDVLTGVYLLRAADGRGLGAVESTRVRFRDYDDRTIAEYVASGEPLGKAGAYAIQGLGAALADGIEGLESNVIGLPVERLPGWMRALGFDLDALRRA
jgi:septum formation protein